MHTSPCLFSCGETVLVPVCLTFVQVCTGNLSLKAVLIMGWKFQHFELSVFFAFLLFPPRSGFNFGVVTSAASSPTLPSLASSQG